MKYKDFADEFDGPTGILSYLNSQGLGIDYLGGKFEPNQTEREVSVLSFHLVFDFINSTTFVNDV